MKTKLTLAYIVIAAISLSCSSDSENSTQVGTTLNKTVEFLPQQSNFDSRTVTHFENNKPVVDTTYNNTGTMTRRRDFIYTSTTSTTLTYNAQNIQTSKVVYTYDGAKRLTNIDRYNGQNQLTSSSEYQYIGHDINVYYTSGGTTVLSNKFKTNAGNLVNYQSNSINEDVRIMSYNNDLPTQMDHDGLVISFQFYPNMKPQNIQNTVNEINNRALVQVLDHVYFSCNYYLKEVYFPPINTTTHYEKTFNADNYQTYMNTYIDYDGTNQNVSEMFFYYN